MSHEDSPDFEEFSTQAMELEEQIEPLLKGIHPFVQGAVLASLTATWLAGHRSENKEATARIRAELLSQHIKAVAAMVMIEDACGEEEETKH